MEALPRWKLRLVRALHAVVTLLMLLTLAFILLGAAVFCSSTVSAAAERFWTRHLWSHVALGGGGDLGDSLFDKIMFEPQTPDPEHLVPAPEPRPDAPPVSFSLHWNVPVGCDWSGFFVEGLGFGVGLARAMGDEDFALTIGKCSKEMLAQLTKAEQHLVTRRRPLDTTARDYHVTVLHKRPGIEFELPSSQHGSTGLVIGRMMTESTKLPLRESRQVERVDEVWVPTEWHRSVFHQAGVNPAKIRVMPEPVDTEFFNPDKAALQENDFSTNDAAPALLKVDSNDEITRFVSVFKWEHRKGWDILLDAYWTAFDKDDPIELHIRTYKPSWESGTKNIDEILEHHARAFVERQGLSSEQNARHLLPVVRWEKGALSRSQLRAFYHKASAFVLPTRGEGWCLPAVEAMSMALPVIVTDFSGPSAYISTDRAYPIGVAPTLNRDGTAEPLLSDVVESMRRVAARPKDASLVGKRARRWVQEHLDTHIIARHVKKSITLLLRDRYSSNTEL